MGLSRAELQKVSQLARLRLGETELDSLAAQLSPVVEYIESLFQIDVDAVEPMVRAAAVHDVFADDIIGPGLDRPMALANAPKQDGECYQVPAMLTRPRDEVI